MTVIRKGELYPYNLDRPLPRVRHPTLTDVRSQDVSVTSPVDTSSATLPQQSSANQPPTTATSSTVSDLDKLFPKLIPSTSPAPTPNNSKVTLETLLASASASTSSTPTSTAYYYQGCALLDTVFASTTPPPGFPAPIPLPLHHVSSLPFPSPPSGPPSTHLAFSQPHQHSDISLRPSPPNPHLSSIVLRPK